MIFLRGIIGCEHSRHGRKNRQLIEIEDPEEEKYASQSFCRARVEIDINKPLVPLFMVPRLGELPEAKIKVKYEKLVKFCHTCGSLGHDERACGSEDDDDPSNEPRKIYDASMCAQPFRTSSVAPARTSDFWPSNQNRGQKERTEEVGVREICMGSEVVQKPVREIHKYRDLMVGRNHNSWEAFNIGGEWGVAGTERGSRGENSNLGVVPVEQKRKWLEGIINGPMCVKLGPNINQMDCVTRVLLSPNGVENYGLRKEGEFWKLEELRESSLRVQKSQTKVMNEEVLGALVNKVERVKLKRGAEHEWSSPSNKRRKTYDRDSPGKASGRQHTEAKIDKWSKVDFRDGGVGFKSDSNKVKGMTLSGFVHLDVVEEVSFVEGKSSRG